MRVSNLVWLAALLLVPPASAEESLVSVADLEAMRGKQTLRVVDVRSEQDYQLEHIEGAVNIPAVRLFTADNGKQYVAPVQVIQAALRKAGIANDSMVVVYDDGQFMPSARAFWVFEVYGHKSVAILDGGFPAWRQAGKPVSATAATPEPSGYVPTVTPNRLATKLTTRLALNRLDVTILDARDPPAFLGETSRATRFGHIASAINRPAMEHFNVDGDVKLLKSSAELKNYYRDLDPNKKVITYCDMGVLSASTYFVLRRLGYDVSNYDGSWLEWGNDTALPINGPAVPVGSGGK